MNLRRVEFSDLFKLASCNLHNIPENYHMRYWEYSILTWPGLSFLAENDRGQVVGYVLSSIEPEGEDPSARIGYINSLSVLRAYRRLGIAQRLMNLTKEAMLRDNVAIKYIQLQVRKSNRPALSLYNKLGYECHHTDVKYYSDGEDALVMRLSVPCREPERQGKPSSQRHEQKAWVTNLWHFIHPHRLVEAAISLLRRRKPLPSPSLQ